MAKKTKTDKRKSNDFYDDEWGRSEERFRKREKKKNFTNKRRQAIKQKQAFLNE